jgi:nucleoside-diphosphate-sugar epimerase
MKIFLTGATGFIGKNFCDAALKAGHFIYAVSRKKRKKKHKNIKWLHGNFDSKWTKELKKSDILVHLAASGTIENTPKEIYEVNVFNSTNLLKNAIKSNLKKWLIISTSSEYGIRRDKNFFKFSVNSNRLPDDDYGLSKAIFSDIVTQLSKKFKCKARIMRIFAVYGKGENPNRLYPSLIRASRKGFNFLVKNPFETRDFTSVNYVTDILMDSLDFKKRSFKNYQVWHISENNAQLIKNFAKKIWKNKKGKGKLIFKKNSEVRFNHISDKKSIWQLNEKN